MAQKYTLDTKKKIITATIEDLDTVEKEIVQMYINAGYILHKGKSNPWNKASISKWLKTYATEKESKDFEKKCEDENVGWVKARAEFFKNYDAKMREKLENEKKSQKDTTEKEDK